LAVSGFAAVAWRQVFASAMMLGVMGILVTGYGIFAVPLAQEFKPSRMLLMLAITVMSIVTAIISPFLGNLIDRVPLKRLMLLGMLSATAALVALSFTTSIYQVLIVYGLLVAPVNVLMGLIVVTVLLSRWFVDRRGRAIGMAMAGMSVVSICLPPLIQWLLDNYDWRVGLRLLALTWACSARSRWQWWSMIPPSGACTPTAAACPAKGPARSGTQCRSASSRSSPTPPSG
jgi:MFS family permease